MQEQKKFLTHNDVKDMFNDIYDKLVIKTNLGEETIRTEKEWEDLIKTANLLEKKYSCTLAKHLILGCMDTLDENEKIYRRKVEKDISLPKNIDISDLSKPVTETSETISTTKSKYSSFKKIR